MGQFEDELGVVHKEMAESREELIAVISSLSDADLVVGRRGGWNVGQVLQHVIESELFYGAGVRSLRGNEDAPHADPAAAATVAEVLGSLERARSALLAAIQGVDEETFYRLGKLHNQDYSVLSVLENVYLHDREHGAQIQILSGVSAPR